MVATDSSASDFAGSDFAGFPGCAGACPAGVCALGVDLAESGVEGVDAAVGAAGVEAGGAVWPMREPASILKATRSRKMRDFIRTVCSQLDFFIIAPPRRARTD